VFFSQEKAKPAVRQGRKITGLISLEDSRVALKRVVRFFFVKQKENKKQVLSQTIF